MFICLAEGIKKILISRPGIIKVFSTFTWTNQSMKMTNNRRKFLANLFQFGAVAAFTPQLLRAETRQASITKPLRDGFTFLFQGDSITDGGRGRGKDWNHVMGQDYAYLISSRLWYDHPKKNFHFFNRGISGNKITDLAARWQQDTLELKPDLLSILVGVNDVAAFMKGDQKHSAEQYEKEYRSLLDQTKLALPNIQLVLCEPFYLTVPNKKQDEPELYSTEFEKRRQIVRRLSLEYNAIFVEFQHAFNQALQQAPAEYWIWDSIHPMPAGHEMMAREWIRQVNKKLKFI